MEIADWRNKIDEIDEQITVLLNKRAECAVEIGKLKLANAAAVYEPQREQRVFEHVSAVSTGPLTTAELTDIYQRVMDVMRNKQRPAK
ncbi:chorismate mutase [Granulicella cerasi]|uniref:chorismate mutase n=1 Tax=Granulicella cerasi TaxID=741063 RepID=A0ABW1ZDC5_9BACT|nr:chorismate mutase [Granulicella cerasi]